MRCTEKSEYFLVYTLCIMEEISCAYIIRTISDML